MSQVIATGLALSLAIMCCLAAYPKILNLAETTARRQTREYKMELEAHRCGRAVAAMRNIRAYGHHIIRNSPEDAAYVRSAVKQLERVIRNTIKESAELSESDCRLRGEPSRGARLYQYDHFDRKGNEPSYSYRLAATLESH